MNTPQEEQHDGHGCVQDDSSVTTAETSNVPTQPPAGEALVQQIAEALYAADIARGNGEYPYEFEQWDEEARAVLPLVEAQVAPLRDEVRRFAKDAADVQTKWLAEEMRANAAEDTIRRIEALADRLDARFLHEDADAIRRVLAGGTDD